MCRRENDVTKIHLAEISSIILETNQIYVSAYLMSELAKNKISLVISDEKHNPIGQYLPLYGAHNCVKRINEQLEWGEPIKKRVWQTVVKFKIYQQARLLEDRDYDGSKLLFSIEKDVRSGDVTNREAHAAKLYFSSLFGNAFNRDQDIPINAALNYGYAILLSMVNREIVSRGYLTQNGICHKNEFNQYNLACDLMEPFRPVVDRFVIDNMNDSFNSEMHKILVDISNHQLFYKDGLYKFSSVVSLFVQDCLNALNKKIDVSDISNFDVEE